MPGPVLITTDLDRTLIFSSRATRQLGGGLPAEPVETSGGQSAGELCHAARDALAALPAHAWMCAATSRSISRLARLRLPFAMRYAIAANGGVVLTDGDPDQEWAERIGLLLDRAAPPRSQGAVRAVRRRSARARGATWLLRMGDEDDMCCLGIVDEALFGAELLAEIAGQCRQLGWEASLTGRKLYAFPAGFGKEHAVAFVARKIEREAGAAPFLLAAGDTEHDRPCWHVPTVPGFPPGLNSQQRHRPRGEKTRITRRPGHAAAAQITGEWLEICLSR